MPIFSDFDRITVLKSDSFLLENVSSRYFYDERFENFKLYLLKKNDLFIVFSPTEYESDDDFTSTLQPYDRIHYPHSLDIYKEFTEFETAEKFYQDILQSCPKIFDLLSFINSESKLYGYDCRNSVHIKAFGKRVRHDEFYVKEFVRHGYQQIMLRIFRFGKSLIINKCLNSEFETEEACIQAFAALKKHFEAEDLKVIPYKGKDTKLIELFQKLKSIAVESDSVESNVSKDELKRIKYFKLTFSLNGIYVNIQYDLPTRNGDYHGYTTNSSIYYSTSSNHSCYKSYDRLEVFLNDLEKVLALFK